MPSGLLVVRGSRSPYSLQGSLPALLISIWHSFMAESAVSWDWGVTQAQRTASTETSLSGKVALHRLALDSHSRSGTTEQSKSPAGNPKGKLAGDFLFVGWPHSALTIILTTMRGGSIPRILTGEKLGQIYLWASDRFFFTM